MYVVPIIIAMSRTHGRGETFPHEELSGPLEILTDFCYSLLLWDVSSLKVLPYGDFLQRFAKPASLFNECTSFIQMHELNITEVSGCRWYVPYTSFSMLVSICASFLLSLISSVCSVPAISQNKAA